MCVICLCYPYYLSAPYVRLQSYACSNVCCVKFTHLMGSRIKHYSMQITVRRIVMSCWIVSLPCDLLFSLWHHVQPGVKSQIPLPQSHEVVLGLYWYINCRHEWTCVCFIISRVNWLRVSYTPLEKVKINCRLRLTITNHTCMHIACVYAHKHVTLQVLLKDMTH